MESLIDRHALRKLEDKYPFDKEELEILVRCYEHLNNPKDNDDFLLKLAFSSPYSYYFLPGDELRSRVKWIEENVFSKGFANRLCAAVFGNRADTAKPLETFLDGIARTGRRGSKEAMGMLFSLLQEPRPEEIFDLVIGFGIACDVIRQQNFNQEIAMQHLLNAKSVVKSLAETMRGKCVDTTLSVDSFTKFAIDEFPMLWSTMSTFVHFLLFHGRRYPENRIHFGLPKLGVKSHIFDSDNFTPLHLLALSISCRHLSGEWNRLYSSFADGRSFNRLEWALMGYDGPALIVIKTTNNAVLGAFVGPVKWRSSKDYYGNSECFLFQLEPKLCVYHTTGKTENYMYISPNQPTLVPPRALPRGLGFGGDLDHPRLFISESFDECHAGAWDKTFEAGALLPEEAIEKFAIRAIEVWGVGGDEVIRKGLNARENHRKIYTEALASARTVKDKKEFAKDFKNGLITSHLYSHLDYTRGRHDFTVDDKHGGYKIDMNYEDV